MNLDYYKVDHRGTLLDAAETIAQNNSRCALVVDQDKVIGIISEGDLVRSLLRGINFYAPIDSIVKHGFVFLKDKDYTYALSIFRKYGISLIPIIDKSMYLYDVITLKEVLSCVTIDPTLTIK